MNKVSAYTDGTGYWKVDEKTLEQRTVAKESAQEVDNNLEALLALSVTRPELRRNCRAQIIDQKGRYA